LKKAKYSRENVSGLGRRPIVEILLWNWRAQVMEHASSGSVSIFTSVRNKSLRTSYPDIYNEIN
jgi:hypothetical protein